jgi:hypothetical protein
VANNTQLPGTSNEIGVFFEIELIISVSTAVDFSFGFDVAFPHDIGFILNPLSGDLVSMNVYVTMSQISKQ